MKKVLAILIALALILSLSASALAEFDLSGLSFEELVALKDQINLAIWNSEEWQEVEVPHGIWLVGEDIPAGKWTITAGDKCSLRFYLGGKPTASGAELENYDNWWRLKSTSYKFFDESTDLSSLDLDLSDGTYLWIDEGSVIFTPYAGKPSLGFK